MYKRLLSLFSLLFLTGLCAPAIGQDDDQAQPDPAQTSAESESEPEKEKEPSKPPEVLDQRTQLDLPEDDTVKITVEPVASSSLVDRVLEPATVKVKCPGAISAEVFLLAVDAPYGGKALSKPRSIGKDNQSANGLSISWTGKETDKYVKLFAVVHKKNNPDVAVRSHTIDLAIGGTRYEPGKDKHNPLLR